MSKQKLKGQYSYTLAYRRNEIFKNKETPYKLQLENDKFYVIRFDGKGMTKGFKIKYNAINKTFFKTMKLTFTNFLKKYPQINFAFSFSDEISILFKGEDGEDNIFSRGEKLISLMAGQLALEFSKASRITKLDCKGQDWLFDARILQLEQSEVFEYFKARQSYAIDKYLCQCRGEYKLDYNLNTSAQIISALKAKNVDYNSLNPEYRFGLTFARGALQKTFEYFCNEKKFKELCLLDDYKMTSVA